MWLQKLQTPLYSHQSETDDCFKRSRCLRETDFDQKAGSKPSFTFQPIQRLSSENLSHARQAISDTGSGHFGMSDHLPGLVNAFKNPLLSNFTHLLVRNDFFEHEILITGCLCGTCDSAIECPNPIPACSLSSSPYA
jgi:hypothetical protein